MENRLKYIKSVWFFVNSFNITIGIYDLIYATVVHGIYRNWMNFDTSNEVDMNLKLFVTARLLRLLSLLEVNQFLNNSFLDDYNGCLDSNIIMILYDLSAIHHQKGCITAPLVHIN